MYIKPILKNRYYFVVTHRQSK